MSIGNDFWRSENAVVTLSAFFGTSSVAAPLEEATGLPPGWVSSHGNRRVQKQSNGEWIYVPQETPLGLQSFYKKPAHTHTPPPGVTGGKALDVDELLSYLKDAGFNDPKKRAALLKNANWYTGVLKKFGNGWFQKATAAEAAAKAAAQLPTEAPSPNARPPSPAETSNPLDFALQTLGFSAGSPQAFILAQFHKNPKINSDTVAELYRVKFNKKNAVAHDHVEVLINAAKAKGLVTVKGDFDSGMTLSFVGGTGPVMSAPVVAVSPTVPAAAPEAPKKKKTKPLPHGYSLATPAPVPAPAPVPEPVVAPAPGKVDWIKHAILAVDSPTAPATQAVISAMGWGLDSTEAKVIGLYVGTSDKSRGGGWTPEKAITRTVQDIAFISGLDFSAAEKKKLAAHVSYVVDSAKSKFPSLLSAAQAAQQLSVTALPATVPDLSPFAAPSNPQVLAAAKALGFAANSNEAKVLNLYRNHLKKTTNALERTAKELAELDGPVPSAEFNKTLADRLAFVTDLVQNKLAMLPDWNVGDFMAGPAEPLGPGPDLDTPDDGPAPPKPDLSAFAEPTSTFVRDLAVALGFFPNSNEAKALNVWRKHLKLGGTGAFWGPGSAKALEGAAAELAGLAAGSAYGTSDALAFLKHLVGSLQTVDFDVAEFIQGAHHELKPVSTPEPVVPPTPAPIAVPAGKQGALAGNAVPTDAKVLHWAAQLGYEPDTDEAKVLGLWKAFQSAPAPAHVSGFGANLVKLAPAKQVIDFLKAAGWSPAKAEVFATTVIKKALYADGFDLDDFLDKVDGPPPVTLPPAVVAPVVVAKKEPPAVPVAPSTPGSPLPAVPPISALTSAADSHGNAKSKLGGNKPKEFLKDAAGNLFLYKTDASKVRAFAGQVASSIAALLGDASTYVPVVATGEGDSWGSVQSMIPDVATDLSKLPVTNLSQKQIQQLQRERVLDWLVSNHDSKAGNFIVRTNGDIVGIDKEQAFKFIGDDELSLDYKPNNSPPVYNALYSARANGKLDFDFNSALPFIQAIEAVSEADYRKLVQPYIDAMEGGDNPVTKAHTAFKILKRKENLRSDFEKFFSTVQGKPFKFAALSAPSSVIATGVLVPPKLPSLSSLTHAGPAVGIGGASEKHFFVDDAGNKFLLKMATNKSSGKPEPWKVASQALFATVAAAVKPSTVPVGGVTFKDKPATLQPWLGDKLPGLIGVLPASLTAAEKKDVADEHVLDWLLSQHDTHGGNLLRLPNGSIIGIDKEQGFKYLLPNEKWTHSTPEGDVLATDYHPNAQYGEPNPPYYNKFWGDFADNKQSFDPTVMLGAIEAVEKISDAEYLKALEPYVSAAAGGAVVASGIYDKALSRKKNIRKDFETFVTGLYERRTKKKGLFTFSGGWLPEGAVAAVPAATAQALPKVPLTVAQAQAQKFDLKNLVAQGGIWADKMSADQKSAFGPIHASDRALFGVLQTYDPDEPLELELKVAAGYALGLTPAESDSLVADFLKKALVAKIVIKSGVVGLYPAGLYPAAKKPPTVGGGFDLEAVANDGEARYANSSSSQKAAFGPASTDDHTFLGFMNSPQHYKPDEPLDVQLQDMALKHMNFLSAEEVGTRVKDFIKRAVAAGFVVSGGVVGFVPASAYAAGQVPKPVTLAPQPGQFSVPKPEGFTPPSFTNIKQVAASLGIKTNSVYYKALKNLAAYKDNIKDAAAQHAWESGADYDTALKRVKNVAKKLKALGGWGAQPTPVSASVPAPQVSSPIEEFSFPEPTVVLPAKPEEIAAAAATALKALQVATNYAPSPLTDATLARKGVLDWIIPSGTDPIVRPDTDPIWEKLVNEQQGAGNLGGVFDDLFKISPLDFDTMVRPVAEATHPGNKMMQVAFVQDAINRKNTTKFKVEQTLTEALRVKTGTNGRFMFSTGWVEAGALPPKPPKPVPYIKTIKTTAEQFAASSENGSTPVKIRPWKVKDAAGVQTEDETKRALKYKEGGLPAVEAFLAKFNLKALGPAIEKKSENGTLKFFLPVSKADLDAAFITTEETITPDEIEQEVVAGDKIAPHSGTPSYFPSHAPALPVAQSFKDINNAKTAKLGLIGRAFPTDGPALWGSTGTLNIKRVTDTAGVTKLMVSFKIKKDARDKNGKAVGWQALSNTGQHTEHSFWIGSYNAESDSIVKTAGESLEVGAREWTSGKHKLRMVTDEHYFALVGQMVAELDLGPDEKLTDVLKELLDKASSGLGDMVLHEPTPEDHEIQKLHQILFSAAPAVERELKPEDFTVGGLRERVKNAFAHNYAGNSSSEPKPATDMNGNPKKVPLKIPSEYFSAVETEVTPGLKSFVVPDRWRGFPKGSDGEPILKFLETSAKTPKFIIQALRDSGPSGINQRLLSGTASSQHGGAAGNSVSEDLASGGAQTGMWRLITTNSASSSLFASVNAGNTSSRYKYILAADELDRLDVMSFPGDAYGSFGKGSGSAQWKDRQTTPEIIKYRNAHTGATSSNETDFFNGVHASRLLRIVCQDEGDRVELIKEARKQNFLSVNGVPIEDFVVVVSGPAQEIYDKYVKPMGL